MKSPYRFWIRSTKVGLLLAAIGFLVEGLFEGSRFFEAFMAPPSVPGHSKIIEHFLVQHALFPAIALLLALRPTSITRVLSSPLNRLFLGVLAALLVAPELVASFGGPHGGDLFRPYPFDLRLDLPRSLQMIRIGGKAINFLRAEHLLVNTFLFSGVVVLLALRPKLVHAFFGPRTGRRVAAV
jgi:hypothetical protein